MKNVLPEFSKEVFDKPEQLDLYSELMNTHPLHGFKFDVSKEEFDKKYLSNIDTAELAYDYCFKYNIKNNPELEKIIATNAEYSYRYAHYVLKDRFKLGEPIIATDPWYSYEYALEVLHGRFYMGEKIIATSPEFSVRYATEVLKGPFDLGESVIIRDLEAKEQYIQFLKSKNIPIPRPFQF